MVGGGSMVRWFDGSMVRWSGGRDSNGDMKMKVEADMAHPKPVLEHKEAQRSLEKLRASEWALSSSVLASFVRLS